MHLDAQNQMNIMPMFQILLMMIAEESEQQIENIFSKRPLIGFVNVTLDYSIDPNSWRSMHRAE